MAIFRAILGVIVGYIVMVIVVMVGFLALYFIMPLNLAFKPGNWDPSFAFIGSMAVLGLVAAVVGGLVCALIAMRGSKASMVLLSMVLVFGLWVGLRTNIEEEPLEREDGMAKTEGIQIFPMHKREPRWVMLMNPFLGAGGIFLGAKLRGGKKKDTDSPA